MKSENSKRWQLDKRDFRSIATYFIILLVGSLIATLPQLSELLISKWYDPALIGFIVTFIGIVWKKVLQDNS